MLFRFINARRRILQPMLDAGNPEQAKAKKAKPQGKPPQRFWPFAGNNSQNPTATSGLTTETVTTSPSSAASLSTLSSINQTIVIPPGACKFIIQFFCCYLRNILYC